MASTGSALFLHGGAAIDGTMHGDSWQWAGGEWKKLQEIGPARRIQHAMAFDTNQSRLVLFGGQDAHRTFADTWEAPTMEPGPPP
jgi:hypothetical protein